MNVCLNSIGTLALRQTFENTRPFGKNSRKFIGIHFGGPINYAYTAEWPIKGGFPGYKGLQLGTEKTLVRFAWLGVDLPPAPFLSWSPTFHFLKLYIYSLLLLSGTFWTNGHPICEVWIIWSGTCIDTSFTVLSFPMKLQGLIGASLALTNGSQWGELWAYL